MKKLVWELLIYINVLSNSIHYIKLSSLKNFYNIFSKYQTTPHRWRSWKWLEVQKLFWDPIFNSEGLSYFMGQMISAFFLFNIPPYLKGGGHIFIIAFLFKMFVILCILSSRKDISILLRLFSIITEYYYLQI